MNANAIRLTFNSTSKATLELKFLCWHRNPGRTFLGKRSYFSGIVA